VEHIKKIALFCDVPEKAVIPAVTSDILYNIPLELEKTRLADYVVERMKTQKYQKADLSEWASVDCRNPPAETS
jgi:CTP synthase